MGSGPYPEYRFIEKHRKKRRGEKNMEKRIVRKRNLEMEREGLLSL